MWFGPLSPTVLADLLCMLTFFGLVVYFGLVRTRRFRSNYNTMLLGFAQQFGFEFNPHHAWNGTVMSGMLGPYRCSVWFETVRRRSRRNRSSTYMHVTVVRRSPLNLGLSIAPQGFLTEGLRLPDSITGNQDFLVGHDAFDAAYRIKGFNEAAVRAYLTPHRINAIMQTQSALGPLQRLSITDQEVSVRFPGIMKELQMVAKSTNALGWLLEQLESEAPSPD